MTVTFYPYDEDTKNGTTREKIELLMEAAHRYKSVVLEERHEGAEVAPAIDEKRSMPKDIKVAFNWEEIASVLKEVRGMPEADKPQKEHKAALLEQMAEVYEVLRSAKMSKLEAVRMALVTEARQLRGG